MRKILLLLLVLTLTACVSQNTPLPPSPQPVSETETSVPPASKSTSDQPPPEESPDSEPRSDTTTFPNPDEYTWETVYSGLRRPVDLQAPSDGSGRLFVVEKVGRIWILQDGQLNPDPYLDISDRVGSGGNEQGLLGLAFHPNYSENGRFFVNYTNKNGNTVVARYQSLANRNFADPASEVFLLGVQQPYSNHNGGALAFGPDGYLYAGLGDGGSAGDPLGNGQSLETWLGKILRIDVDTAETPYGVPSNNPFNDIQRSEIWAYGLRNPWRISFDRVTGDLFIGDVGQNAVEEVNFVPAGSPGGLNFGWKYFEGSRAYDGAVPQGEQVVPPVVEYDHSQGCSVTGGYVYRGTIPEWYGIYLYGDYCTGMVWGLLRADGGWKSQALFSSVGNITSFGQDENGEIYVATDSGQILRLERR